MLNLLKQQSGKPLSKPIGAKMRRLVLTTSSFMLLALSVPAEALRLTRGPYLQSGSTTGVIVKWRTDSRSNGVVKYGTSANALNLSATQNSSDTNHEVAISGLKPDTRYFYSVGSDTETLAGGNSDHFFSTSPEMGATKSFRIWAVGDSGTANSSARAVKNSYLNFTGNRGTDLMLMLGDNAYNDGTDREYQRAVFDMYPELLRNTVVWSTLGNHDGHSANSSNQSGPYYDIFSFPRNGEAGGVPSGTEAYYSFDYGNIHFIVLDSYETNRSANGTMMNWLREDAAATDKDWLVAIWHHPPYSKGSHDSDRESQLIQMRENALPILEENGIDLLLSGHSHSYERSFLIDGHYGNSRSFNNSMKVDGGNGKETGDGAYQKSGGLMPNEGAVYIVAGSSGKTSGGSLNHPAMFLSTSRLGSVVMDVEGPRMDVRFLDDRGNTRDNFTLVKSTITDPPVNVAPVANAGSNQTVNEGAKVTLTGSGTDPDGTIASYKWSQVGGSAVTLTSGNAAVAGFTAPQVNANTKLTFKLEVTDNLGLTASDRVAITVQDSVVAGGADLVVNTLTLDATTAEAGGTLNYIASALNQGTAASGENFLRLVLSTDAIIDGNDTRLTNPSRIVTALAGGANLSLTGAVQIPVGTAPGIHYLGAMVDSSSAVAETDETNNTRSVTITVTAATGSPDLVVGRPQPQLSTVSAGGTLSFNVVAMNRGDAQSARNFVRIVLSRGPIIGRNDRRLTKPSLGLRSLASGQLQRKTGTVTIPADTRPGNYYLGAIVDPSNRVSESDESNNMSDGMAITVTAPSTP